MGRYFARGWKGSRKERDARHRRVRLIPLLLMLIGAATVLVAAMRYLIVPLLVFLGGRV